MRITLGKWQLSMSQPFSGPHQFLSELLEMKTTNILKFDTLEKIPDAFLRI